MPNLNYLYQNTILSVIEAYFEGKDPQQRLVDGHFTINGSSTLLADGKPSGSLDIVTRVIVGTTPTLGVRLDIIGPQLTQIKNFVVGGASNLNFFSATQGVTVANSGQVLIDAGTFSGTVSGGTVSVGNRLFVVIPGSYYSVSGTLSNLTTLTATNARISANTSFNGFLSNVHGTITGNITGIGLVDNSAPTSLSGYSTIQGSIHLGQNSTVRNGPQALISGDVSLADHGTVLNYASMTGNVTLGTYGSFFSGGNIRSDMEGQLIMAGNYSHATLAGAFDLTQRRGVTLSGSYSTLAMIGTFASNILLSGNYDTLQLDPGVVQGGAGFLRGNHSSKLELLNGVTSGSLDAFVFLTANSFGTLAVDPGANWSTDTYTTLTNTVIDAGTLTNRSRISSTVTVLGGGTLVNLGTLAGTTLFANTDPASSFSGPLGFSNSGKSGSVKSSSGGTVRNAAGGTISGGTYGVRLGGTSATIDNAGLIAGGLAEGARLANGGYLLNRAGGTITGGYGVYIGTGGGAGTIINNGTITATRNGHYVGVNLSGGGKVVNGAAGLIASQFGTGLAGVNGTVANYGTIRGGGGTAVQFGSGVNVLMLGASGSFNGNVDGGSGFSILRMLAGGSGTLAAATKFTNFAFIEVDPGANWTIPVGQSLGIGVDIAVSASLTNAGTLTGSVGATLELGSNAFSNAGNVSGSSAGIASLHSINTGASSHTVTNSGSINGAVGINFSDQGVYFSDQGANTVVNSGTIVGTGGTAVLLGAGNDHFVMTPEAAVSGVVDGQGGRNVLELAPSSQGGASGSLYGLGTSFANFGSIVVDSGADWFVALARPLDSGVTLSDLGTLRGNLSLGSGSVLDSQGGTFVGNLTLAGGAATRGVLTGYGLTSIRLGAGTGQVGGFNNVFRIVNSTGADWTLSNPSSLVSGGTISNLGTLRLQATLLDPSGTMSNSGKVVLGGGTLSLGALASTGTVSVVSNATLAVAGTVEAGQTVAFDVNATAQSGSPRLKLGSPAAFAGVIAGFSQNDILDLTGVKFDGSGLARLAADRSSLTVTEGGHSYSFRLSGAGPGNYARLVNDGAGGTAVTLSATACYCRGTLILTDAGERPVEELAAGDLVVTANGSLRPIRWIGRRRHAARSALASPWVMPITFRAGALADDVPRRDLSVSPLHAMFIDGVLVPAHLLVNGHTVVQARRVQEVAYFHLELDSHDVIWAEGAPSETFSDDDSRGMFENAAEHRVAYPKLPGGPVRFCAPVVHSGERLDAILRGLAERSARLAPVG